MSKIRKSVSSSFSINDSTHRNTQAARCIGCNIKGKTKHRCYVLFNPELPNSLPRCLRCEKKKKGCSLAAYERRASTNSEKRSMVSTEGYELCMLVQLIAKTRKAAGLVVPRTPEDAVRMLRGCHPDQDTVELGPPGEESTYEDYTNVTVD